MSIDRQQVSLFNEGQVLSLAGNTNEQHAAEYARAAIDGFFNALLRLEGSEETARYAFALADRVVGRVKVPTAWPLLKVPAEPKPEPPTPPPPPPPPKLTPLKLFWASFQKAFSTTFLSGFAWGFLAALLLVLR